VPGSPTTLASTSTSSALGWSCRCSSRRRADPGLFHRRLDCVRRAARDHRLRTVQVTNAAFGKVSAASLARKCDLCIVDTDAALLTNISPPPKPQVRISEIEQLRQARRQSGIASNSGFSGRRTDCHRSRVDMAAQTKPCAHRVAECAE
jgi:hypothetical protein